MKVFNSLIFLFLIISIPLSCKTSQKKENTNGEKAEITRVLPQKTPKEDAKFNYLNSLSDNSKLFINMTSDNRVLLNSVETTDSILKIKIREFILEKKTEYAILVQSHNQTKYSTYLRIQKIYKDVYTEIKNEYSVNKFKTPYESLETEKKHETDSLFPENIIEFEPTN